MKTIILNVILSASIFAGDLLDNKIIEYCKSKASVFTSKNLYEHVYTTCYQECKKQCLTVEQFNKQIETETNKKAAKNQARLDKEAKEEQNKQIMKLPIGDWKIRYFVDRFGDKTNEAYITNKNRIRGTFSNSATTNSKLDVIFIISSPSDIAIKLFEYAHNNPVREKSYMYNDFNVYAKDKNGESITYEDHYNDGRKVNVIMRANLKEDRLVFNKESTPALNKALLKGGKIRFNIEKASRGPLPEYSFILGNADYYDNALKKLSVINNGY